EERALVRQAKGKSEPSQHGTSTEGPEPMDTSTAPTSQPQAGTGSAPGSAEPTATGGQPRTSTGPPLGNAEPTAPVSQSQASTGPGSSIQVDGEEGAQAERRGPGAGASPSGREAPSEAGGGAGADAANSKPAAAAASGHQAGDKPAGGATAAAVDDSLDAFMSSMADQQDDEKLRRLKRSLEDTQLQLARTERLLKIADPDGWLKPDSKAAQAAKVAAQEALEAERRRHEAASVMAVKRRKEAQATGFVEEVEEDEEAGQPSSSGRDTKLTGG
ncbi:hypothetical protein DUNSADRAFT_6018, partial [Dunaliella salina]